MRHHVDDRTLAAYIGGLLSGADRQVASHILACPRCRRRHDEMRSWLAPRYRDAIEPTPALYQRIRAAHRRIVAEAAPPKPRRSMKPVAVAAAMAVAAAVMIVYAVLIREPAPRHTPVAFTASAITGDVRTDGRPLRAGMRLGEGTVIALGPRGATARIAADESIVLRLYADSRLRIDEARAAAADASIRLRFTLTAGSLASRIAEDRRVSYRYLTPHARIDSIGTEFLLSVTAAETSVRMIAGSVTITSLATGETRETVPGRSYRVGTVISEIPAPQIKKKTPRTLPPVVPRRGRETLQKAKEAPQKTADDRGIRQAAPEPHTDAETPEEKKLRLKREETRREDLQDMRDLRNLRREKR